jgi:hypothetical protein
MRSSSRLAKSNQTMLVHAAQPALLREKLSENEKASPDKPTQPNQTMLLHAAQPALLREKLSENEKLIQVSQTKPCFYTWLSLLSLGRSSRRMRSSSRFAKPNHAAVRIPVFSVCSTLRARTNSPNLDSGRNGRTGKKMREIVTTAFPTHGVHRIVEAFP